MYGAMKIYESMRSKSPPCPGMNLPLSLTPARRLMIDSNKSPQTATPAPTKTMRRYAQIGKSDQRKVNPVMLAKISQTQLISKTDHKIPPTRPEIVFPGLILGQSFLPPITEPVSIAKVSLNIGIKIAVKRMRMEISTVKPSNFASASSPI